MSEHTREQLEKMVYSEYWSDREIAANQGYGLDILINDKEWMLRWAVATQGYGLEKLVNDESPIVRKAATVKMEELGYAYIGKWVPPSKKTIFNAI